MMAFGIIDGYGFLSHFQVISYLVDFVFTLLLDGGRFVVLPRVRELD